MDSSFGADLDQNQGGDSNVKRRRAKGEAEGNYVCGCGKVYLSYPALYTHIKTKHDGVTPAGTTQPQSSNKTGRGRPKKGESVSKAKEEDEKESHNENNDNQMAYGGILNYLKILELEYKYDDQSTDVSSIVSTIPDNFDLVAQFPTDILKPTDYAPVLAELDNIVQSKNIGAEELDEDSGLKKTNLNRIFAIFIYLIGRHLKEKFYREFVFFLMMYRRALNEVGWKIKESVGHVFVSEANRETEFCANNNAEFAPEISNDFITEKWGKYLPQYSLTGFKVIGTDLEATKNAVFLTQNFCNWLSLQGYSDSYLSINEEEASS